MDLSCFQQDGHVHLGIISSVPKLRNSKLLSRNSPVLSYRDLSAGASGLDRFIPVYSDESKVMTCFLEFDRPDTVLVHDLVYSREGEQWHFEKSSYRKLRLPVEWLENAMIRVGFSVQSGQAGRLLRLVGQKH